MISMKWKIKIRLFHLHFVLFSVHLQTIYFLLIILANQSLIAFSVGANQLNDKCTEPTG